MYPVWSNSRRVSHFFVRRKKCVSEIKSAIRFEPVGTWINSKGGEKHYRDWTRKKRENDFERSQGLTQLSMLKQVCWWVSEWVRGREVERENVCTAPFNDAAMYLVLCWCRVEWINSGKGWIVSFGVEETLKLARAKKYQRRQAERQKPNNKSYFDWSSLLLILH